MNDVQILNMKILNMQIELAALICEKEAMLSENIMREHNGQAQAYGEQSFFEIAEKIRALLYT